MMPCLLWYIKLQGCLSEACTYTQRFFSKHLLKLVSIFLFNVFFLISTSSYCPSTPAQLFAELSDKTCNLCVWCTDNVCSLMLFNVSLISQFRPVLNVFYTTFYILCYVLTPQVRLVNPMCHKNCSFFKRIFVQNTVSVKKDVDLKICNWICLLEVLSEKFLIHCYMFSFDT